MSQSKLVVANWKMHGTINESLKRITTVQRKLESPGVTVVMAPPFTALYSASVAMQDTLLKLGAQNLHWESEGAFTGEVSASFLKDAGCDYVIVGHSERRRYFDEDDELINKKLRAALSAELIPILCIGETADERGQEKTFERLEEQLKVNLKDVHVHDLTDFCIAYEPVWAIGSGKTPTVEQIGEVHNWIRTYIGKKIDAPTANNMRLLYGGSVKADNAKSIMEASNVDGLLVGGASLDTDEFVEIIHNVA